MSLAARLRDTERNHRCCEEARETTHQRETRSKAECQQSRMAASPSFTADLGRRGYGVSCIMVARHEYVVLFALTASPRETK